MTDKWNKCMLFGMQQESLFETLSRWTVAELTRYIRQVLESDDALQDIWVQGEISNLSRPASGHLYFTLKDAVASLRCVMWRSDAARLRVALQDGLAVEMHGSIRLYEPHGQYQLVADAIRSLGEGALFQEFLRLKAALEAEGLFDPARKRPIPERPRILGIVTSPTGAALQDILNTLRRRYPFVEVVLAASPVQGEEAPAGLAAAVHSLNRLVSPDVILLARGGGSMEDLWAFNDPGVVRAVVDSHAPVITGVGHETDFTLVDFAADLRAPTPTAAAEMATPVTILDLRLELDNTLAQVRSALDIAFDRQHGSLDELTNRLRSVSPLRTIQTEKQRLDDLLRRIHSAQAHLMSLKAAHLAGMNQRLVSLNPWNVLARGYAVVTGKLDKKIVSHVRQVSRGDALQVRLQDGQFEASVTDSQQE